jgi:hypothetical protein
MQGSIKMKVYLIIMCLWLTMIELQAAEKNSNVLILDVSKAMQNKIDGLAKFELLKSALTGSIQFWPKGEKLSVVTYQPRGQNFRQRCQPEINISASKRVLTKQQLTKRLHQLERSGNANTIYALQQAKRQLRNQRGNIILTATDNNSCEKALLCEVAKYIKKNNPRIVIHAMDMQGNNEALRCVASVTGGQYYPIQNAL